MSASSARIAFVTAPFRTATAADVTRKTSYPLAQSVSIESFIELMADAQALADDELAWRDGKDEYQVEVIDAQFLINAGDTITLEFNAFGLAAGRAFFVAHVGERSATGKTSLTLIG